MAEKFAECFDLYRSLIFCILIYILGSIFLLIQPKSKRGLITLDFLKMTQTSNRYLDFFI